MKKTVQIFAPLTIAVAVAVCCVYFYAKAEAMTIGMLASVTALAFAFLFSALFVVTSKMHYKVASHQAIVAALGCATGFMLAGSIIKNYSVLHSISGILTGGGAFAISYLVVEDHERDTNLFMELLTPIGLAIGVFCLVLGKHQDWTYEWHLILTFIIPTLFICVHTGMNSMWFESKVESKHNTLVQ